MEPESETNTGKSKMERETNQLLIRQSEHSLTRYLRPHLQHDKPLPHSSC